MSPAPLPEDVRAFVREHISSVEQLEILLLLHRTSPREWTALAVGRELRIDPVSAARRLADFETRGVIRARPGQEALQFWYEGTSPDVDRAISQLTQCFRERRTSVVNLILSVPTDAVRIFADAFRLKRPSDE